MSDEVSSTTQIKHATEAKSRQNAKKVKTYHAADRGDYNVNFPVPGTGGAQDIQDFWLHQGNLHQTKCFIQTLTSFSEHKSRQLILPSL